MGSSTAGCNRSLPTDNSGILQIESSSHNLSSDSLAESWAGRFVCGQQQGPYVTRARIDLANAL